jgi:hypothetical protein
MLDPDSQFCGHLWTGPIAIHDFYCWDLHLQIWLKIFRNSGPEGSNLLTGRVFSLGKSACSTATGYKQGHVCPKPFLADTDLDSIGRESAIQGTLTIRNNRSGKPEATKKKPGEARLVI